MTVRSVQKAIDILIAVAEESGPATLTEIATKVRIPVATASRLLHTLTLASLLRRDGKGYTLGIRAFEIGKKAEKGLDLIGVSRPHLRSLADRTGENANLAVLDGTDVVYLICEECSRMMRAFTVSGARVSAHATCVGKVLLSGLLDSRSPDSMKACLSTSTRPGQWIAWSACCPRSGWPDRGDTPVTRESGRTECCALQPPYGTTLAE